MIKFRTLILIFCLLVVVTTITFFTLKVAPKEDLAKDTTVKEEDSKGVVLNFPIDALNTQISPPFSRIIYAKDNDTFSATLEGKDEINLTKRFSVVDYDDSQIVANRQGSKVAFVTKSSKDFFVSVANSDSTESRKVFTVKSTGCDVVRVGQLNDDGTVLLLSYSLVEDSGDGPGCKPKADQVLEYGGYYLKQGQEIQKLPETYKNEHIEFTGFYEDKILFVIPDHAKEESAIWQLDPTSQSYTKIFSIPKEFFPAFSTAAFFPRIYVNQVLGIAFLHIIYFGNDGSGHSGWGKIVVLDYAKGVYDIVADGGPAEFQQFITSPNLKNIIYAHKVGAPPDFPYYLYDYYLYDIFTKKSTKIQFGETTDTNRYARVSIHWIDDDSFLYRWPSIGSWPEKKDGEIFKFDLTTGEKTVILKGVSDLK